MVEIVSSGNRFLHDKSNFFSPTLQLIKKIFTPLYYIVKQSFVYLRP